MRDGTAEIATLAENMVLVASYWMLPRERELFDALAKRYVARDFQKARSFDRAQRRRTA